MFFALTFIFCDDELIFCCILENNVECIDVKEEFFLQTILKEGIGL